MDLDAVRAIESAAADALRPDVEFDVDGWRFRTDPSGTRRANSVFPERAGVGPLVGRIHTVVEAYRARGATPRMQVTHASQPEGLVRFLVASGWTVVPGAHVLVRPCAVAVPTDDRAAASRVPAVDVEWTTEADTRDGIERWFGAVRTDRAGVVSTGTAVVDRRRGLVGLFSLATQPGMRNQGWGTALVTAALERAHADGIEHAYLQVDVHNHGARRLYERLGFTHHHDYSYAEPSTSGDGRSA